MKDWGSRKYTLRSLLALTFYGSITGKSFVVGPVFNHLVYFQRNLSFTVSNISTASGLLICPLAQFNALFLGSGNLQSFFSHWYIDMN